MAFCIFVLCVDDGGKSVQSLCNDLTVVLGFFSVLPVVCGGDYPDDVKKDKSGKSPKAEMIGKCVLEKEFLMIHDDHLFELVRPAVREHYKTHRAHRAGLDPAVVTDGGDHEEVVVRGEFTVPYILIKIDDIPFGNDKGELPVRKCLVRDVFELYEVLCAYHAVSGFVIVQPHLFGDTVGRADIRGRDGADVRKLSHIGLGVIIRGGVVYGIDVYDTVPVLF